MFMALAAAATSSSSLVVERVRSWRTAFLTLRDETQSLASLPQARSSSAVVLHLLNHLILSQSDNLIGSAPDLPPHEVTSDIMLLMELARNVSDDSEGLDSLTIQSFVQLSRFIQIISSRVSLIVNSTSWALSLDCFQRVVDAFLGNAKRNGTFTGNAGVVRATKQCLETIRLLLGVYQRTMSLSENKQLLNFLHGVIASFQADSISSSYSNGNLKVSKYNCIWEVQKLAFVIIGEVYSRVGASLPVDIWQSTIEVLRTVTDSFAAKGLLAEDSVMPTFYYSVLHCLHLVLVEPKGSLSAHMSGFIAALKMFLNYGAANKNHFEFPEASYRKVIDSAWKNLNRAESSKTNFAPYRPPHLRKKELKNLSVKDEESLSSSAPESSTAYHTSSDSDYSSDGDGSGPDMNNVHSDRTRFAAIICIQDLCRADPKLITSQWTMLLPCTDVLQPRKKESTLMSCLLFDPFLKARLASASTITTMLDGTASVFLQVAEFKDSTKCGSFTALSCSLGQILMQLHSGTLFLVKHENHKGLLASLFKVLMALISCTPYSRMPAELLPTVISSVQRRIEEGLSLRSDHTSLLAPAINCLTVALSLLPPSLQVREMLLQEVATGFSLAQKRSGILSTLFRYSDPMTSPSVSFEALQALRAVAHNYPSTMFSCWKQVSSVVYGFLSFTPDVPARFLKNNAGYIGGANWEKGITAAIKVLDECLRAVSGFKGTEDLSDDKFLVGPFTSDCVKTKSVSSAPFYGPEGPSATKDEVELCPVVGEQWSEVLVKHMPLILRHSSATVRAASVTCFAGLTYLIFYSLGEVEQGLILSSSLDAAVNDEVPSVRSAACRAIGVIACFPQVIHSIEILDKLVYAAVHNTNDSLVSVRITASWALANICDSLRHCVDTPSFECDLNVSSPLISVLIDSALRLSNDNDKIKANAVRALGNLARFVQFASNSSAHVLGVDQSSSPLIGIKDKFDNLFESSNSCQPATFKPSYQLEKLVQTFISCVTTGNVKVQWNVCHALSNLFLNRSLKLQDMNWAPSVFSILLLLLRDSANFKIKIQAAAALAVPTTINDYGRSFCDVLQGMVQIVESLSSDQISTPYNFKYRVALEKQMTSTMLHMVVLASETDDRPIKVFLAKKAMFLEDWLKALCSSLEERRVHLESEHIMYVIEKREVISRALQALIRVFEDSNHHAIAPRFHKLLNSMH